MRTNLQIAVRCDDCGAEFRDRALNTVFYVVVLQKAGEFLAQHRHCCEKREHEEIAGDGCSPRLD